MYHKITVSNMTNNELWVSKKSIDHIIELLLLLPFKKCVWASQGLSKINTQKTTLQWWSCAGSVVMLDGAPQVIHTSSRLTLFYPIFSFFMFFYLFAQGGQVTHARCGWIGQFGHHPSQGSVFSLQLFVFGLKFLQLL